jgi:3'-5' exoribonuclease
MKSPYVSELEPSQITTGVFLVQNKEIRQKKTGEPYLSLLIGDRTGDIEAKMWDNVAEVVETFEKDDFVRAKGLVQIYNNRPQFVVHRMRRVEESEVDLADFFPASQRDPQDMLGELRGIVLGMENRYLRALLELFLADEEIVRRLVRAPAAKFIHHAFLGGLLEHVLSLCRMCRLAAQNYASIDLDLLLAGAILHDVGKIYELSYDRGFGYTSEGQLLGHIVIGLRMIDEKLRQIPDFPPKTKTLLEHLVISHHGTLEFGSPKVPLFPEALVLHYLDDMDAKLECMRALVEHDRQAAGHWTTYSNALERVILKKTRYLSGGAMEKVEAEGPETPAVVPAAPIPVAPEPAARPVRSSPFADKLAQALGGSDEA